jgi:hypothetical protein
MDPDLKDILLNGEAKMVDADEVQPHPDNPRQGNIGLIYESIKENGWYGRIGVHKATGNIIVGNHRFLAGREIGMSQFPAEVYDVDEMTAKRIMLVDNRSSDEGTYDDPKLIELLIEQADQDPLLLGTGYNPNDLDDMIDNQDEGLSFDGDRRLTPDEKKHIYDSSTIRQIQLIMDHGEYGEALRILAHVIDDNGLDDNTSAVMHLLREYEAGREDDAGAASPDDQ